MAQKTDNDMDVPSRRQRAVLNVPEDFLRVPLPASLGAADVDPSSVARPQFSNVPVTPRSMARQVQQGKLSVTIAQAKLGKNYGMTRMDPYARIRVGHYVFETDTETNGATNPRWDKTFVCYVPSGINSIYVEVYDERTFGMDERIAWGHFTIPQRVFEGDALDDWWPLSGKQGEQKEGMIELVFSYEAVQPVPYCVPGGMVMVTNPGSPYGALPMAPRGVGMQMPYLQQAPGMFPTGQIPVQQQAVMLPVQITEEDIKQLKEMFPNVEDEVIKSVLEEKQGHKQAAINALLSINDSS